MEVDPVYRGLPLFKEQNGGKIVLTLGVLISVLLANLKLFINSMYSNFIYFAIIFDQSTMISSNG